jgi:hypothetical protein
MGPTALLLLRRKSCYGFLSPLKIDCPQLSLNPKTLGPLASTITTRPPRLTGKRITMDVKEIGWDGMDWFHLAQDGDFWQTLINMVLNFQVP